MSHGCTNRRSVEQHPNSDPKQWLSEKTTRLFPSCYASKWTKVKNSAIAHKNELARVTNVERVEGFDCYSFRVEITAKAAMNAMWVENACVAFEGDRGYTQLPAIGKFAALHFANVVKNVTVVAGNSYILPPQYADFGYEKASKNNIIAMLVNEISPDTLAILNANIGEGKRDHTPETFGSVCKRVREAETVSLMGERMAMARTLQSAKINGKITQFGPDHSYEYEVCPQLSEELDKALIKCTMQVVRPPCLG